MTAVLSRWLLVPALLATLAACATTPRPPGAQERGLASWYGHPFHGRLTASGERYDMHAMTAAHRLYPFGTRLRVTSLDSGRFVVVRVNDRGPFVRGRIIDLSYAAASAIDMVGAGTARVRLDRLPGDAPPPDEPAYTVQVAAFQDEASARGLQRQLGERYGNVFLATFDLAGVLYYRVRVGRWSTVGPAEEAARRLGRDGFSPFVTRQDGGAMLR